MYNNPRSVILTLIYSLLEYDKVLFQLYKNTTPCKALT